jgi:DNA-directed RNA polymerase specialized sigma24 family protein
MNEKEWNEVMKESNKDIDNLARQMLKTPYGSLSWEDLSNGAKFFIWESFNKKGLLFTMAKRCMLDMIRHEKVDKKYSDAYFKENIVEGCTDE